MYDASCSPVPAFSDGTCNSPNRMDKGGGDCGHHRALLCKGGSSSSPVFRVTTGARRNVLLPGVAVFRLYVLISFDYAYQGPQLQSNASSRWSESMPNSWGTILPCVGGGNPNCTRCAADGRELSDHVAILCSASHFLRPMLYVQCDTCVEMLPLGAALPMLDGLPEHGFKEQLSTETHDVAEMIAAPAGMFLTDEARSLRLEYMVRNRGFEQCLGLASLVPLCLRPEFQGGMFCRAHENINQCESHERCQLTGGDCGPATRHLHAIIVKAAHVFANMDMQPTSEALDRWFDYNLRRTHAKDCLGVAPVFQSPAVLRCATLRGLWVLGSGIKGR